MKRWLAPEDVAAHLRRMAESGKLTVRTHRLEDRHEDGPRAPRKSQQRVRTTKRLPDAVLLLLEQIMVEELPAPILEHRFDAIRKWRFDLAYPDRMLAIEVDGAVYAGGRHTRGKGFEGDCAKFNEAALQNWRVLRYSSGMVKRGEAVLDLKRALA